jgi:iron complex outermembrane receptor protein
VFSLPTRSLVVGVTLFIGSALGAFAELDLSAGNSAPPRVSSSVRLKSLSLEELMQLEVSTVSRKTEPWWTSPGAVDVVTSDEIDRSGAMNLPDALRLATGVHVGEPNAQSWAIGIRGFNILSNNKINVQLDGLNLFTPFFSGVSWATQDTLLEDVDRIEVVRGAAGALWGNYAMNGFIQILTKPAWDTQGLLATAVVGTEIPGAVSVRYGGSAGSNTFYRAWVKYSQTDWTYNAAGRRSQAPTDIARAGFRTDSKAGTDGLVTIEGGIYTDKGTPKARSGEERFSGGNLLARWRQSLGLDSDVQVTTSYDESAHAYGGFFEKRRTGSLSAKYRVVRGPHDLQFGADALWSRDRIDSVVGVAIEPPSKTYYTGSLYAQDAFTLIPRRLVLTGAAQVQSSVYSGEDVQPTLRLAWTPEAATTWWTAVSRAVRTPVRIDTGLVSRFNGTVVFQADENLKSEKVVSLELGVRHRFSERVATDLALFANSYDNMRSYESATSTYQAFPWTFKNTMNAETVGAELTVLYQPSAWLFFKSGYRYINLRFTRDPGSGDFRNGLFEANDARHVGYVTARFDLPGHWTFDTTLRGTSGLPAPAMRGYITADARLAWSPQAAWEFALIGQNLTDPQHPEFVTPNSTNEQVARSVTLKATWRF